MGMVQLVFETGELVTKCIWATIFLLHKVGGEYCSIGLVDAIWNVIALIIDRYLADSIEFRDVLHKFMERRGTGTATIEAKLLQKIVGMHQAVL